MIAPAFLNHLLLYDASLPHYLPTYCIIKPMASGVGRSIDPSRWAFPYKRNGNVWCHVVCVRIQYCGPTFIPQAAQPHHPTSGSRFTRLLAHLFMGGPSCAAHRLPHL